MGIDDRSYRVDFNEIHPDLLDAHLNQINFRSAPNTSRVTLKTFYYMQIQNQKYMLDNAIYEDYLSDGVETIPGDYPKMTSYHLLHLLSELGEVLEADKRWKSHRKNVVNLEEKQDEIIDLFIITMNLAIYSGMTPAMLENKLEEKLSVNQKRLFKENA